MSTVIRPEISDKNKYFISRHRYYELLHFCLQYPDFKKLRAGMDFLAGKRPDGAIPDKSNRVSDPTSKCAEVYMYYSERIDMIEKAAKETDEFFSVYILKGVTEGYSFDYLKNSLGMPCCRQSYYNLYRRFFWILNKYRK